MKSANALGLTDTAINTGATSPVPTEGHSIVWSTSEGRPLYWNGSEWRNFSEEKLVDVTGSSYTVTAADSGKMISVSASTDTAVTLPDMVADGIYEGFSVTIANRNISNSVSIYGTIGGSTEMAISGGESVKFIIDANGVYRTSKGVATALYPWGVGASTYTVTPSDSNRLLMFAAAPTQVFLPDPSTLASWADVFHVVLKNRGSGVVTVTALATFINTSNVTEFVIRQGESVTLLALPTSYYTSSGASVNLSVRGINNNYTLSAADCDRLVSCNSGSPLTLTLPDPTGNSGFYNGFHTIIQNRGTGTLTLTPEGSGVYIDNDVGLTLGPNEGVILFSNGTDYFTFRGQSSSGSPAVGPICLNSVVQGNGVDSVVTTVLLVPQVLTTSTITCSINNVYGGDQDELEMDMPRLFASCETNGHVTLRLMTEDPTDIAYNISIMIY